MIVFIELLTFMMALVAFIFQRSKNIDAFSDAQLLLNTNFGVANTILLVTAGFFMAVALQKLKQGNSPASIKNISIAIIFGISFLGLKSYEYFDKIKHGIGIDYSDFFLYYWFLTGFHFIHVFAGITILVVLVVHIKKGYYSASNFDDVESGAIFWHMCDLIWLLLFPILYLL